MKNYVFSDVDKSLTVLPTGNVKLLYNEDVIIQSLKILIATFQGEMPRTTIGSRIMYYLGKPMTSRLASLIEDELLEMIARYETRVSIRGVRVNADYDNQTYDIELRMVIKKTNRSFNFRTGLRTLT